MEYPIVQVQTKDQVWLHGLFVEASNSDTVFLHIHGTASNFYEMEYIETMAREFSAAGISVLSTNNHGSGVYDAYQSTGAAVELFEQCLIDIDAWIEFAKAKGYSNIILAGHSLGSQKAVYYIQKGTYREMVRGLVLLGPADATRCDYTDTSNMLSPAQQQRVLAMLDQAKKMVAAGKGEEFLPRTAYMELMPKSAKAAVNILDLEGEAARVLPFQTGELKMYRSIVVPVFVAIADQREWTGIDSQAALLLMKKENLRTETHYLNDCDHDFTGKENELVELLIRFLTEKKLMKAEKHA